MNVTRLLGRGLQLLALVILPLSMILELNNMLGRRGLAHLLLFLIFGFAAFQIGRYLEGYARTSS